MENIEYVGENQEVQEIHNENEFGVPKEEAKQEGGEQKDQKKPRKKANIYRFKPEMITDRQKGLLFLYDAIGKLKMDKSQNFSEIKELNKYIRLFQEWHYYVVPKYDQNYFIERCQKFGTQPAVKSHMSQLRNAHKGIIPWDFVKVDPNKVDDLEDLEQLEPNQRLQPNQTQQPQQTNMTQLSQQLTDNPFLPDQQLHNHMLERIRALEQTPGPSQQKKKIIFKPRTDLKTAQKKLEIKNDNMSEAPLDQFYQDLEEVHRVRNNQTQ